MKTRRNRRRGFTLMEILLVLAILVVLGSMVTVGFVRMQKNAYINTTKSQISLLEDAVQAYTLSVGVPPNTQQGLEALIVQPGDLPSPEKWTGPYLDKQSLPLDPWGNQYEYEQINADQFRIWSPGPDKASGSEDDISSML